jgi:hypothetical protein
MNLGLRFGGTALAGLLFHAPSAHAEVVSATDGGFVIRLAADAAASRTAAWQALIAPGKWWSDDHTYSGKATNMYIDAQATGCFCEKIPRPADAPETQRMGSVEHMHVIYADPAQGVLRMSGGLGPLQGEAVKGTLTMTVKTIEGGSRITWEYAVGGFMRMKPEEIAPLVDQVLSEQIARLAASLTPPSDAAAKDAKPAEE